MMHISELKNIDNLDSMESGLLHTIQYYDIVQIRVPKGYNIPIELLNLTPYEWKDLLNKAAKSHVEQIISQTHNSLTHRQPASQTHSQPLGNAPHNSPTHNSQPAIQILNDTTDYYSEQQIANYYCLGQTSKIHPLDKYHLDKQTHHEHQQQIEQQIEHQQIEHQQIEQQIDLNKDIKNQNNCNELYPDLTQSYKSLQCVVC